MRDTHHVLQEWLLVLLPVERELLVRRILGAAQLQRDLEVVGIEVVPVLHAARHAVPPRSVHNSARKLLLPRLPMG